MDTDNLNGLEELLAPILSDPDTMEKLRQEAEKLGLSGLGAFGGGDDTREHASAPGQPSGTAQGAPGSGAPGGMGDIGAILAKLMPLISGMSEEDDSTRLLHALRPFLGEKRGKRLDEASRMLTVMHIIKLLPDIGAGS